MLRSSRKLYFTLIELFLVFALLTMVGGVLAFNLRKGIDSERYLTQVQKLAARLQIAQQLMYVAQMDFEIEFEESPNGVICNFRPVQALSPFLQRVLESAQLLTGVREVKWHSSEGVTQKPPFTLTFFSRGALVPRGELELISEESQETRYLLIAGDGRAIHATPDSRLSLLETTVIDANLQQQLYPAQLREWAERP